MLKELFNLMNTINLNNNETKRQWAGINIIVMSYFLDF